MEQTEVRKAMTYIESKNGLRRLSAEYTEDALHRRFSTMISRLSDELQEYNTLSEELERTDEETDWNSTDKEKPLLAQKLLAERASLKHMREVAQKKYDSALMYETWLNEYGNEFAQLYRIKDNHEKRGYDEELEIREIDITDNGDVLTNDKYNKMNAYAPEPLTELVLHVTAGENEEENTDGESPEAFGFNFGVMEFNQPNMPPQVKIQLSFDNETLENLDEAKLKRIFAFCDAHGISVSDLQIRRFDGSLAEDLIREKIEQYLEKAQEEKENRNKLENKKEKSKEEVRHQELEDELLNIKAANKGKTPEELSWDDVSADVVPEHRVMKAVMAPLAREFVRQSPNNVLPHQQSNVSMAERQIGGRNNVITTMVEPEIHNISDAIDIMSNSNIPPVQTISQGVSASEIVPPQEITREIIETAKGTTRNTVENTAVPTYQEMPRTEHSRNAKQPARQIEMSIPMPEGEHIFREAEPQSAQTLAQQSVSVPSTQQQQAGAPATPPMPKLSMSEVEKGFEKLIEKGWAKRRGLSYYKTHTGWFKSGWTEYVIYDTEDKDNRKKDGVKQKDGSVKYTYSFKLFLRMESDGLHFTYRTPNHRKVEQDYINDIAGKLKDLGYTHINFPAGISNAEKGMWRKAMAENGIVPLSMSLNVKHAREMIKVMKETEKYDAQTVAEYGYRLAQEMQRSDAKDGKTPNLTRKTFIDGLINTHRYFAFTNAYSEVLKNKIERMLRQQDQQTGSPDKFAAYLTLRRVFDLYKLALENGNSLLNIPERIRTNKGETITLLTNEEKRQLRALGLGGNVEKLRPEQLDKVFDVLYTRQTKEEYNKFKTMLWEKAYASATDYGPRLAPNVVFANELDFTRGEAKGIASELKKLGIEDFQPFEDTKLRFEFDRFNRVDLPEYRRLYPPQRQQNGGTPQQNSQSSRQASQESAQDLPQTTRGEIQNGAESSGKKKVIVRRVKSDDNENTGAQLFEEKHRKKRKSSRQDDARQTAQPTETIAASEPQSETPAKVDVSKVVANTKTTNTL